jgi:hypothetical protein
MKQAAKRSISRMTRYGPVVKPRAGPWLWRHGCRPR